MKVSKFGGSSLASSEQMRKVEQIVKSDDERQFIVVSAPGKRSSDDIKITDMLYTCSSEAKAGKSIKEPFGIIRNRYLDIVKELGISSAHIERELDEIERNIVSGRTPDYAASRGEYLCAVILSDYLGLEFVDAEGLIIIRNDNSVDPKSYKLLADTLAGKGKCIIPGFYGSAVDGKVKTFTRGGSDITGAIVSKAVNAELYENWTDVSGILMADPRVVNNPNTIIEITYEETRELASIGAAVFHEEAIAPVRDALIPINIRNTNRPEDAGTRIVSVRDDSVQPIVGVSGKKGYTRLFLKKLFLNKDPEFLPKLNNLLESFGIVPEFSSYGFDSLSLFFKADSALKRETLMTKILTELEPDEISSDVKLAMIGLVGEGLYDMKGVIAKVSSAVADSDIAARYLNYGGSLITCIIGVDEVEYQKALQSIYTAIA